MKKYIKPTVSIVRFENSDDNMRLLSGNYNIKNIKYSNDVNVINF